MIYDVLIIGLGFVGMMVVIYVKCVNLKVMMFEKGVLGG